MFSLSYYSKYELHIMYGMTRHCFCNTFEIQFFPFLPASNFSKGMKFMKSTFLNDWLGERYSNLFLNCPSALFKDLIFIVDHLMNI